MTMRECIRLILERRAIWFFDKTRDVNINTIKEIIEISSNAPSGKNLQPWEVIVIKNSEIKNKLKCICDNQQKIEDAPVVLIVIANTRAGLEHVDDIVKNRTILGFIKPEEAKKVKNKIIRTWKNYKKAFRRAIRDTSLFAMTIMITARAYGLETHPIGCGEKGERRIKKLLGIEKYKAIVMLIAIGYRDMLKELPERPIRYKFESFGRIIE